MAVRAPRLPGVRFEASAPPLAERLPRMDVAVFVGFAAAGPLDRPVAVEDVGHFEDLFGRGLPLAWDPERGEVVEALLAPAVRAFFRNGGRRCWVIRVAGAAGANVFPVRGLARVRFTDAGGSPPAIERAPAFAPARSEGSWSDALRASTALVAQPVQVVACRPEEPAVELLVGAADAIEEGDLLRLQFGEGGRVLMFAIAEVDRALATSPPAGAGGRRRVLVRGRAAVWLQPMLVAGLPGAPTRVHVFRSESGPSTALEVVGRRDVDARTLALRLRAPVAEAPEPGALVRVDCGAAEVWLSVRAVNPAEPHGSPPEATVEVEGDGVLWLEGPPSPPVTLPTAERLTFELWVRAGERDLRRLGDLGFDARHERFWAALPTDADLYPVTAPARPTPRAALWSAAVDPRFPLAGSGGDALYVPLAMPLVPDHFLGAVSTGRAPLERDGLDRFGAGLFFDARLAGLGTEALLDEADFLRYRSAEPRPLRGLHAALEVQEATIIAIPDGVHRGWSRLPDGAPPAAEESSPPARPDWWHFLPCDPPRPVPRVREPEWGQFLACGLRVLPVPRLGLERAHGGAHLVLAWEAEPGAMSRLEEATRPDFSDAVEVYAGPDRQRAILGRGAGDYYYRVRIEAGGAVSDWSHPASARIVAGTGWGLDPVERYDGGGLADVHRALLRLCAARGDLFAILGLPEHYREADAIAHAALLRAAPRPEPAGIAPARSRPGQVAPFGGRELAALSYGALYHPWLVTRDETAPGALRRTPPDGAAAGVLARRALARGAWIAPANEPLRDVVDLVPAIAPAPRLALQEARVNLVRQEPRGFLALAADTLSADEDLRPVNVRRLLILLRRLALRTGAAYVFEPNDDAFRRLVQRGLETVLRGLFERGAFAGATAASSFQVVADPGLNTLESVERGRLIVELKVAPSLPTKFLTVRLVQSGDRLGVEEI